MEYKKQMETEEETEDKEETAVQGDKAEEAETEDKEEWVVDMQATVLGYNLV